MNIYPALSYLDYIERERGELRYFQCWLSRMRAYTTPGVVSDGWHADDCEMINCLGYCYYYVENHEFSLLIYLETFEIQHINGKEVVTTLV